MTTNGSGVMTWEDRTGGLVFLGTQTAANTASVSFTSLMSTTYSSYMVVIENIAPVTDGATFQWFVSTDNGSSYVTSSGAYSHRLMSWDGSSVTNSGSNSNTAVDTVVCGSSTGETVSGTVYFTSASLSTYTQMSGQMETTSTSGVRTGASISATRLASEVNNAIKFNFSSGNINTGTIHLYGFTQ